MLGGNPPSSGALPSLPDFSAFNLIGESPRFRQALAVIPRIARCEAAALIEGETGTGKELAARAIHSLGDRRDCPFVPVNCGAIPDHLVENELFGHVRGAYTDARETHEGLVAEADGGTLFLDEVETLSPRAQVALLRFLQDGTFRRLGRRGLERTNVRILAASNAVLSQRVDDGAFRMDLLYRLAVMSLHLPPLRERGADVERLANHFTKRLNDAYGGTERTLDPESVDYLYRHDWPGNVRELENLLHRRYLLDDGPLLRVIDEKLPGQAPAKRTEFERGFHAARAVAIEDFEKTFLTWALTQARGNVSLAARRVGKERRAFGKLMKKYGIGRRQYLAG